MKLQLQYGKRYVRRDGKITGELVENNNSKYPFLDALNECSYKSDGRYLNAEHEEDLVQQCVLILSEEKTDAQKLSGSLLAACKAAGIDCNWSSYRTKTTNTK
jgi:hypothetical protein